MITSTSSARPLEGRGIVITRPAEQAEALAQLVHDMGGRPLLFPAIDIRDASDPTRLNSVIDRLNAFDLAIFISPNAAVRGMRAIRARRELPKDLKVVAIGGGTARELLRQGVTAVIFPPQRYDSESLLELPELRAVSGLRAVIFRGEGGRAVLGDTLVARGASVEYAECYVRSKPDRVAEALVQAWPRGEVDAVVVTSSEGLRNLFALIGEQAGSQLLRTTLFAPHSRIASTAHELGFDAVVVTEPGDEGIARGLAQHFAALD